MTHMRSRTPSAVPIRRPFLLAVPFALVLAACSGRQQTALSAHATEGYGSSSPPRVSLPPGAPNPYAPYDHLTDSLRRTNGP